MLSSQPGSAPGISSEPAPGFFQRGEAGTNAPGFVVPGAGVGQQAEPFANVSEVIHGLEECRRHPVGREKGVSRFRQIPQIPQGHAEIVPDPGVGRVQQSCLAERLQRGRKLMQRVPRLAQAGPGLRKGGVFLRRLFEVRPRLVDGPGVHPQVAAQHLQERLVLSEEKSPGQITGGLSEACRRRITSRGR